MTENPPPPERPVVGCIKRTWGALPPVVKTLVFGLPSALVAYAAFVTLLDPRVAANLERASETETAIDSARDIIDLLNPRIQLEPSTPEATNEALRAYRRHVQNSGRGIEDASCALDILLTSIVGLQERMKAVPLTSSTLINDDVDSIDTLADNIERLVAEWKNENGSRTGLLIGFLDALVDPLLVFVGIRKEDELTSYCDLTWER